MADRGTSDEAFYFDKMTNLGSNFNTLQNNVFTNTAGSPSLATTTSLSIANSTTFSKGGTLLIDPS